ncbi:MAG: hypothetical protein JNK46_20175 [Methylobacteriaceae bacterium]|nr:hypothetical protein [Methylobacteriaceae bacterium]
MALARLALVLLLTAPATALAQSPAAHNCQCRSARGAADLGERLCLATPSGWRIAICSMDQNVTSWKTTPENCAPVSRRRPAPAG